MNGNLKALAETIEETYKLRRSEYESRKAGMALSYTAPKSYGGRHGVMLEGGLELQKPKESIWFDLAKKFLELRIDPIAYIALQFTHGALNRRAPEPAQLLTDKCLGYWRAQQSRRAQDARTLYSIQRREVESAVFELTQLKPELGAIEALVAVISAPTTKVSALFRYMLALEQWRATRRSEFRSLMRNLFKAAAIQYLQNEDGYREVWNLSEKFQEGARREYKIACREDYGVKLNG